MVDPLKLPSPSDVKASFDQLGSNYWIFAFATFKRILVGLSLGTLLGIAVGLNMIRFSFFNALVQGPIELVRPIPPVALIPFFIFWLGLTEIAQITLISLGSFMVVVVTLVSAGSQVDRTYLRAGRSLGADESMIVCSVIWPLVVPILVAGLRVAAGTAFGVTIAAEYLGADGGLGYLIRNARTTLSTNSILLAIITLGVESWILDFGLRMAFRPLISWQNTDAQGWRQYILNNNRLNRISKRTGEA